MKQWHRQVLIDKNLEVVKYFYPTSGGAMFFGDQKVAAWKVDRTANWISGQFENGKYTRLNVLPNGLNNNNNSSNTVLVFSTITLEDRSFKKELENIRLTLFNEMKIPDRIIRKCANKKGHPIEILRTIISSLGENDSDFENKQDSGDNQLALRLIAQVPTIVSSIYRMRNNQKRIQRHKNKL